MQRRHFLRRAAATTTSLATPLATAAATTTLSTRLFAGQPSQPRFLLVFLRGGYDAANLLVPLRSNFYREARPTLAIAPPSSDLNTALPLDADWGLHPALRDSLYPLFKNRELAFVPFAGSDDSSRSHFETQDSLEMGQPSGPGRDYRSGFLNRLCATLHGVDAMAFTEQLPLVLQGKLAVPNTALRNLAKPSVDARQSALIAAMYQGSSLGASVAEGFEVRSALSRELATEMEQAGRQAISAKGFELEAIRIAHLMQERYRLGFVDVGGWDTHVGEGGARGYLANRFDELGRGLASFAQALGPAWRDTVVVVLSEFGRTFRQNGNGGTDHGHGSVYWVLGGSLRGGRVLGEQVAVERATLFQDRDYPVLNDYRALLGGLFARLYGLGPAQSAQVFAGVAPRDMGLL